jgi:hypothetical protein
MSKLAGALVLSLLLLGCGALEAMTAAEAPSGPVSTSNPPAEGPEPVLGVALAEAAPGIEPQVSIPEPPPPPPESLSPELSCGLRSPMPGSFTAGYSADTGLDLAGIKMSVHAIADGKVIYAEAGHSLWSSPRDTDLAVLIELDEPLDAGDRKVTHVWYAHLSELAFEQPRLLSNHRRVVAGERLGTSGVANGSWHLHLGLLLDGDTSQRWGTFLLEDEARKVLCGLRARQRLPEMPKPSKTR